MHQITNGRLVLDEDHGHTGCSGLVGDRVDSGNGAGAIVRSTISFAKSLLYVNDQYGCVH
jgi:hypothetical protein